MAEQARVSQLLGRLQTLLYEERNLLARIEELRGVLAELEEARKFIESGKAIAVYRNFAGRLLVGLDPQEALKAIEEEEKLTKMVIERLERRLKEVREELAKVREELRRAGVEAEGVVRA